MRRLMLGWATHFAQIGVGILQQLLLVPIFLNHWSQEMFAGWLTIYAVGSLVNIADCGLSSVGLNLFQRARAARDPARRTGAVFSRLLSAYLFVVAAVLLSLAGFTAVCLLPGMPLPEVMKVPGFLGALVIVVAATALQLPSVLSSVLYRANDLAGLPPVLSSTAVLIGVLAQWLVVANGGGLLAVAIVHAAALLGLAAYLMWVHQPKYFPDVHWAFRLRRPPKIATELRASAHYGVPAGIDLTLAYVPILLVSIIVNDVAAIAVWGVARTLIGLIRQVGMQTTLPLMSEIGREYAFKRQAAVASLLFAGLLTVGVTTAVLCGGLLSLGPELFAVWTRYRIAWDGALIWLLVAWAMIGAPTTVAHQFAVYSGEGVLLSRSKVMQITLFAVISLPATAAFGVYGLATALAVAELAALTAYLWPQLIARNIESANQAALLLALLAVAALLLALALGHAIDVLVGSAGIASIVIKACLWGFLALGATAAVLWRALWRNVHGAM